MDHVIVVQSTGVAIAHTLHQQLQDLLHIGKTPFVSIGGQTHRRGIYRIGRNAEWVACFILALQPVVLATDGGILPAEFDEKKNHPLQFLERMVPYSCFYSLFTEWSLKIH